MAETLPAAAPNERAALEIFITQFIGGLASDTLTVQGNLNAYLAQPEAERSGDEVPFIDFKITPLLLACLGYASKEVSYNPLKKICALILCSKLRNTRIGPASLSKIKAASPIA